MKVPSSIVSAVIAHPVWKKVIRILLRMMAWLYDFVIVFVVVAWGFWSNLVWWRVFGVSPGSDYAEGWEQDIYAFELKRGLSEGMARFVAELPWWFEFVFLVTLSALLVRWTRRFVRTTPGEWTFSVRRAPRRPPADGISRRLARILAGIFALFVGVLVCAGVLFPV